MSLCEGHCEYLGYNDETKNSICECGVKKEISILNIKLDYEGLYKKFDGLTSSNIDIIKCYHLIFRKKNLLYNIGFYILLIIILFFIISIFIFIFKGYKLLKKKINFVISITINKSKNNKKIGDNNNLPTTILASSKIKKNKNSKSRKAKKDRKHKKERKDKKDRKDRKDKNNPPLKKDKNRKEYKKNGLDGKSSSIRQFQNSEDLIEKINIKKEKREGKEKNENKIKNEQEIKDKKKERKSQLLLDRYNLNSKTKTNFGKQNYLNDYELNRLIYKEAIKIDKRTYFQYYLSLLKIGNLFLFSFVPNNDYNSMIIKICFFFFSFGIYYTVNALFFTDSTMGKIYDDNGKYDIIFQIPKILYSNLICTVINIIIKYLSLSEKDILKIKFITKKENINAKVAEIKKCLIIKFILYYLVSFILLIICWFYVSCFCAVYKNTQLYLIKDVLISFTLSLIYPLG